jgi:hypothetical protein
MFDSIPAALSVLHAHIKKVRDLLMSVKNSNIKRELLKAACAEKNLAILAPILDVETRWNSTYAMIFRAIQLRKVMSERLQANM